MLRSRPEDPILSPLKCDMKSNEAHLTRVEKGSQVSGLARPPPQVHLMQLQGRCRQRNTSMPCRLTRNCRGACPSAAESESLKLGAV